jgi:hypothetical protein
MCGHKALATCYGVGFKEALNALALRCLEPVDHSFADCGHSASATCSSARSSKPKCPLVCGKACPSGHLCQSMYVTFAGTLTARSLVAIFTLSRSLLPSRFCRCSDCNNGVHDCNIRCE